MNTSKVELMKKIIGLSFLITLFTLTTSHAQEIKVIDVNGLEALLNDPSDKLRVINFWATWCKPCIAELPYFESARKSYKDKGVEILLVSVDFVDILETKVKKFVQKKNLQSDLYLLDELDANKWVDMVSKSWQGDIPATVVINNAKGIREFHAKEFNQESLNELINKFL